jgi:hypothetical protein
LTAVDDAIMRLGEERVQLQRTAAEQVGTRARDVKCLR